MEQRVRGGRPRRGRGGVGGSPISFEIPQPPRRRLGVRPAAGMRRRPARTAPAPGRPRPPAGHRGVRPPRGLPGEGMRPPARHGISPHCPGYFQPGPAAGARGVTRAFGSSRRRGRAAEMGSPRGKTRRGEHLRRACPSSWELPPRSHRPPAPLASGDSPLSSFPSGTAGTGPGAGPPLPWQPPPPPPARRGRPAGAPPAPPVFLLIPPPGAPALTAAAAQDGPGCAGRARLREGCAGSSAARGRSSAGGGAGPPPPRTMGRALVSMQAPPPPRQARVAERRRRLRAGGGGDRG